MQKILALMPILGAFAVSLTTVSAQDYYWTTIAGLAGNPGSADGTNNDARFRAPRGLALDQNLNVYVADTGNSAVRKLMPVGTNWVASTIAGFSGSRGTADGTNNGARFNSCGGLTVDVGGNLFVADTSNHTIRIVSLLGTNWVVRTIAGQAGSPGGADGTNSTARFSSPAGVAAGGVGSLYVADTGNSTIRLVTTSGTNWVVSTLAGLAGNPGATDGTNSDARFWWPAGLGVRTQTVPPAPPGYIDFVYVADTSNSIVRQLYRDQSRGWPPPPVQTQTIAGAAGQVGSADGAPGTAEFNYPAGIAVDQDANIFVADSGNNTVRKLTPAGPRPDPNNTWVVSTIGGLAGSSGFSDGTNSDTLFNLPQGIAVDRYRRVFVADTQNHTIRMGVVLVVPPTIQSVAQADGMFYLTWASMVGRVYQLQYKTNLAQASWSFRGNVLIATGPTTTISDPIGAERQRFYRVVLLP